MTSTACACGCGSVIKAGRRYAPGHRPTVKCERCGLERLAYGANPGPLCPTCKRRPHARVDDEQRSKRALQKASPPGKLYCHGCEKYRSVKFFGRSSKSRCKKCYRAQAHESRLLRNFNMTMEQYDALKAKQGGKCYICQRATGASRALAVDHDHACCPEAGRSCGKCIRGLLCSTCNHMLGHARDQIDFFERAAEYLSAPPARS